MLNNPKLFAISKATITIDIPITTLEVLLFTMFIYFLNASTITKRAAIPIPIYKAVLSDGGVVVPVPEPVLFVEVELIIIVCEINVLSVLSAN